MELTINENKYSFDAPVSAYEALKAADVSGRELLAASVDGKMGTRSFYFTTFSNFERARKTEKNEENRRKTPVFLCRSF